MASSLVGTRDILRNEDTGFEAEIIILEDDEERMIVQLDDPKCEEENGKILTIKKQKIQ
jgi:hypothetical protein